MLFLSFFLRPSFLPFFLPSFRPSFLPPSFSSSLPSVLLPFKSIWLLLKQFVTTCFIRLSITPSLQQLVSLLPKNNFVDYKFINKWRFLIPNKLDVVSTSQFAEFSQVVNEYTTKLVYDLQSTFITLNFCSIKISNVRIFPARWSFEKNRGNLTSRKYMLAPSFDRSNRKFSSISHSFLLLFPSSPR